MNRELGSRGGVHIQLAGMDPRVLGIWIRVLVRCEIKRKSGPGEEGVSPKVSRPMVVGELW